ncbi:unnamed protein product [Amoebophrya sp. A25]|nr:unnamed protein product [Amoebophrya sp. A25]|eukprot:GSA25T00013937001.1
MEALRERLGTRIVRCNITPDGYGDAVVITGSSTRDGCGMPHSGTASASDRRLFVKPAEVDVSFESFYQNVMTPGALHAEVGGSKPERLVAESPVYSESSTRTASTEDGESDDAFDREAYACDRPREDEDEDNEIGTGRHSTSCSSATSPRTVDEDPPKKRRSLDSILGNSGSVVPYLSLQNDCLRQENAYRDCFHEDQDKQKLENFFASFGKAVFGQPGPEALNLWAGDERSLSSFHKDNYENLYYVASGRKLFWLAPPAVLWGLYIERHKAATYSLTLSRAEKHDEVGAQAVGKANKISGLHGRHDGRAVAPQEHTIWSIDADEDDGLLSDKATDDHEVGRGGQEVSWSSIDLRKEYEEILREFPDFEFTGCKQIWLEPGEMLYLPRLWYHAATQVGPTIALNAWFDMPYDQLFCLHSLLSESKQVVVP